MRIFNKILQEIALPLRTITRGGGVFFSLQRGMLILGIDSKSIQLPIAAVFTIFNAIVTYRARKRPVKEFFSENKIINEDEDSSIKIKQVNFGRKVIYYFFIGTNYLMLPSLELSATLSGWAIFNALGDVVQEIVKLISDKEVDEISIYFQNAGVIFGLIAGIGVCAVFVAFQGKKTKEYANELVTKPFKEHLKLGRALLLGLAGTTALSVFAYFTTSNAVLMLSGLLAKNFNVVLEPKIVSDLSFLTGAFSAGVNFFNMGLANNYDLHKFLHKTKEQDYQKFKTTLSKSSRFYAGYILLLLIGYTITGLFQFFAATADTVTESKSHSSHGDIHDLGLMGMILTLIASFIISLSGTLIHVVFNREAFFANQQDGEKKNLLGVSAIEAPSYTNNSQTFWPTNQAESAEDESSSVVRENSGADSSSNTSFRGRSFFL